MFGGRRFKLRPLLTAVTALSLITLVSLGNWQLQRLYWKRDLIAKVETRIEAPPIAYETAVARAEAGEDMEYMPVEITGKSLHKLEQRIFGAIEERAGAFIFTPIEREDGTVVYLNRGYVPQAQQEWDCFCTDEVISVEGLFRYAQKPSPPAAWFISQEKSIDGYWLIRDPALFAAAAGIKASSYYVDSFERTGVEWPKGGTTRLNFRNKHLEYALTWFGLAGALLGVWLVFSLQEPEKSNNFKK